MSVAITLKKSMARSLDAVSSFTQYAVMIVGLLFVLGTVSLFFDEQEVPAGTQDPASVFAPVVDYSVPAPAIPVSGESLVRRGETEAKPQFAGVLDYVKRRYRVSPEAVMPIVEVAELIGKERRIDPLLILAIIGIESGFNPFAESALGARGLMQVIPRFHMDKVPAGLGSRHLFDPAVNIRVGVGVLEEAIRRRGGLVPGLQQYAGSSDTEGGYANKVLAEKARMEKAVRRNPGSESKA